MAMTLLGLAPHAIGADKVVKRQGQPDVHMVKSSDPGMAASIKRARSTVATFIKKLMQKKPSQTYFSVKAKFSDGSNSEHIWLSKLSYMNGKFHGYLGNKPLNLKNYNYGDPVTVVPNQISDWMIIKNNTLVGGYTIRYWRDKLSKEEREKFDRDISFKFE